MPKPDECLFDFIMNGCSVRRSFWVKRCGDKEKRKDIDAIGCLQESYCEPKDTNIPTQFPVASPKC